MSLYSKTTKTLIQIIFFFHFNIFSLHTCKLALLLLLLFFVVILSQPSDYSWMHSLLMVVWYFIHNTHNHQRYRINAFRYSQKAEGLWGSHIKIKIITSNYSLWLLHKLCYTLAVSYPITLTSNGGGTNTEVNKWYLFIINKSYKSYLIWMSP